MYTSESVFTMSHTMEGYDNEFVPHPEPRYECPICLLVHREPYQTKCGHIFCRNCIIKSLRVCSNRCPVDNEPLQETDIYPDNFARREILSFNIRCSNSKNGCDMIFPLRKLQSHLEECSFALVSCPNKCACILHRSDIADHVANSCENRILTCMHCCSDIQAKDMKSHVMVCPKVGVTCPHCEEKKLRSEMEHHVRIECQQVEVHCPFYILGCTSSMVRSMVDEHLMLAGPCHMKELCHAVQVLSKKLGVTHFVSQMSPENVQEHLNLIHSISSQSVTHSRDPGSSSCPGSVTTDGVSSHFDALMGHLQTLSLERKERKGEKSLTCGSATETMSIGSSGDGHQSFSHPQSDHFGDSSLTNSDMVKTIQEISSQIEDKVAFLQQKFEDLHDRVTAVEQANFGLVKTVEDLEQHMVETGAKLYNGDFCWCISNFSQYQMKLEAGESSTIHSSPFYTNPWGYKLCIRVTIDKNSENEQQLSLFIHFMKSKNDAFLTWPFSGKIYICVLDQNPDSSKRVHIKEILEANPNLAAFQRPTTPRNHKGFGYINFISITALKNSTFLLHDTLAIRIQVTSNSK